LLTSLNIKEIDDVALGDKTASFVIKFQSLAQKDSNDDDLSNNADSSEAFEQVRKRMVHRSYALQQAANRRRLEKEEREKEEKKKEKERKKNCKTKTKCE